MQILGKLLIVKEMLNILTKKGALHGLPLKNQNHDKNSSSNAIRIRLHCPTNPTRAV